MSVKREKERKSVCMCVYRGIQMGKYELGTHSPIAIDGVEN